MLPWQPIFDKKVFFSENGNPFYKMKKITFLTVKFVFLAHISVSLLVLIIFCLILALY